MQKINGVEIMICTIDSSYDELTCAAETTFSAVHILTWSPELQKVQNQVIAKLIHFIFHKHDKN